MGQPLQVMIVGRPQEYGAFNTEQMFDGGASFWCTPPGAGLPQVMTFQLYNPGVVDGIALDPRVAGYDNCAPRDITVELAPPHNPAGFVFVGSGVVMPGQVNSIAVQPYLALVVRITINSNHGGPCVVISELRVLGPTDPGTMSKGVVMHGKPVDPYGKPVDPYGKPVDPYGKPVDPYGKPVDPYGKPVDAYGKPVDAYGKPVDAYGNPVDPYGKPVDAYGKPVDPYGNPVDPYGAAKGFQPGHRVLAQWTDGGFYPGTISQTNAGMYEVVFDAGTSAWVGPHQLQPA